MRLFMAVAVGLAIGAGVAVVIAARSPSSSTAHRAPAQRDAAPGEGASA